MLLLLLLLVLVLMLKWMYSRLGGHERTGRGVKHTLIVGIGHERNDRPRWGRDGRRRRSLLLTVLTERTVTGLRNLRVLMKR